MDYSYGSNEYNYKHTYKRVKENQKQRKYVMTEAETQLAKRCNTVALKMEKRAIYQKKYM